MTIIIFYTLCSTLLIFMFKSAAAVTIDLSEVNILTRQSWLF